MSSKRALNKWTVVILVACIAISAFMIKALMNDVNTIVGLRTQLNEMESQLAERIDAQDAMKRLLSIKDTKYFEEYVARSQGMISDNEKVYILENSN